MSSVHIDIELPTAGIYSLDTLKEELTKYAMKLVGLKKSGTTNSFAADIKRIQDIAKKTNLPQSEIDNDDRLDYLLNH